MSGPSSEASESVALSSLLPMLAWSSWLSYVLSTLLLPGARGKFGQSLTELFEVSASWSALFAYASCLWLLPAAVTRLWRWPAFPWMHVACAAAATVSTGLVTPHLLRPLNLLFANFAAMWGAFAIGLAATVLALRRDPRGLWLSALSLCAALRASAYFWSRLSSPQALRWAPQLGTWALVLWLLLLAAVTVRLTRRASARARLVTHGCLVFGIALCVLASHPRTAPHLGLLRHSLAAVSSPPLLDGMRLLNGWRAVLSASTALGCLLLANTKRPTLWALAPLVLAGGALDAPLGNVCATCAALCVAMLCAPPRAAASPVA